jgi:hypothetical protein
MLHCRECGTSTVIPLQRNSAQNGTIKTVAAAGISESRTPNDATTRISAIQDQKIQADGCQKCGAEMRPGMLSCRACGTAKNQKNADTVDVDKTRRGRLAVNSTGTTTSVKATESQPIQLKPSPDHARPPLSSKSSSCHENAGSVVVPRPHSSAKNPEPREGMPASQQPKQRKRVVETQQDMALQRSLTPNQTVAASDTSTSPNSPRKHQQSLLRNLNWRMTGIFASSIAGLFLAVIFAMRTTPAKATSKVDPDKERAAAIWVVEHYGVVQVKTDDGEVKRYVAAEHLPATPFKITEINLYEQEFDENELSFLPELVHLEKIDISRTAVSDTGMRFIGKIPKLKSLQARAMNFSAESFRLLQNGKNIENCTVSGSKSVDDTILAVLVETMPNLKVFSCTSTSITDAGLKPLMQLKSMRKLTATKQNWSEPAVKQLREALPDCKIAI